MGSDYTQDVAACFADRIGACGLSADTYARCLDLAAASVDRLRAVRDAGERAFLTVPERRDDLPPLRELAARYRDGFDDVLILGTGGSTLGGRAVADLARHGGTPAVREPRLHILDNVDPDSFETLLAELSPDRTAMLAISKSGGTAETLAQTAVVLDYLRGALGDAALPHCAAVMTESADTPLGAIARRFDLPILAHDPILGGRFSALSTGVVPAYLAGIDPVDLRSGAAAVTRDALRLGADLSQVPSAVGAAIQVGLMQERMVSQTVLMPYADRLQGFARWFRQLWAESLGKAGGGSTPIDALGAVDQHSQLQLYLDGPTDKLFTLVDIETRGQGPAIDPAILADPKLAPLAGRTLGDLMSAEATATAESLAAAGRPMRRLHLPALTARGLGALLQHFMLETAIAADVLGVNAYDQPAVEDGKRRTKAYLKDMGDAAEAG